MTQKEEECTICLEFISDVSLVGVIQPCLHYYHDHCVLQWSSNSNTCPTCRNLFYKIEVKRRKNPKGTLRSVEIQDKLLANDAINDIPQEFVVQNDIEVSASNNQGSNNGICIICSSSDYRVASREMLSCGACNAQFHSNCIGLTGNEEEQEWFCPICDYQQEWQGSHNTFHVFSRNENITTRTCRSRTPRVSKSLRATKDKAIAFSSNRHKPGLIIHNENDELDDDFLYDNNNACKSKRIINGGVLLRKELEIKEKLTKDEAQSWDLFEQAKSGEIPNSMHLSENSSATRRRRRKKLTPIDRSASQPLDKNKTADTRISGLIKQIQANNDIPKKLNHNDTRIEKNISFSVGRPASVATSSSSSSSSSSSMSMSSNESALNINSKEQAYILDLEQKIIVQRHVRNKLRPLYNSSKQKDAEGEVLIPSEECYITINKNISRKIYNYISKLGLEGGVFKMKKIEDVFNEENTLKDIVYKFVNEELKKYIV